MKHHAFPRRALPVLLLAALLLATPLSAAAFPFDGKVVPYAAATETLGKNALAAGVMTFTPDDFHVETAGQATPDAIVFAALPPLSVGVMTLGTQQLCVGDSVRMDAVSALRFTPATPIAQETAFSFTPVFPDGASGAEATVALHLLAQANAAPIAEDLTLATYKNVAITGQFSAKDLEGDQLHYQLREKPARGAVTLPADGTGTFVYTPYENKTGKDTFTYVALDAVGNVSAPATVKLKIEKANTKVTYADMAGQPAYRAALRLAETGVFVGERMDGAYFFRPAAAMTRGEFVAMAMNVCGVEALEDVDCTGFADDAGIPVWAKPYVASALKAGLVQGSLDEASGQVFFRPESGMTRAEAAVFLDRALQIADVSAPVLYPDSGSVPAWAYQSAVNLETCGVLRTDDVGALALDRSLTRADAAELLCGALEVLEAREDHGWFHW